MTVAVTALLALHGCRPERRQASASVRLLFSLDLCPPLASLLSCGPALPVTGMTTAQPSVGMARARCRARETSNPGELPHQAATVGNRPCGPAATRQHSSHGAVGSAAASTRTAPSGNRSASASASKPRIRCEPSEELLSRRFASMTSSSPPPGLGTSTRPFRQMTSTIADRP